MPIEETRPIASKILDESNSAPLTVDARETIRTRINREPEFARALISESIELLANGDPDVSRMVLRDVVEATIGFENLADSLKTSPESLREMLSQSGNPTMNDLSIIVGLLRQNLLFSMEVTSVGTADEQVDSVERLQPV
ncbi:DNA-binding protein [cf. Phormidesmis sp. LEGE 11477]|uniref:helix-turn-helix domain-containing transcriptional regulator n=1 Tax=cf. Phormidesmis sp. LEGE 11477 TaxID=1828680 RepID=UPI00187EE0E6|nr:transcriptional regulator [cf. Phormidesmis sp. LEGE 11477]MBE9062161.1 transcriptional regulator [cf. Phormidesmis sp. LEGE 11477]